MRSWIASLASWMFRVVVGRGGCVLRSLIPLYAVACVMVASFAPCRLNSLGISRDRVSSSGLFAPSFVSWSLCSLPGSPLCPLIHLKLVVAVRLHRR